MTEVVIRVVLADDHPVVRGGLRALLESLPAYEVVGEAVDGDARGGAGAGGAGRERTDVGEVTCSGKQLAMVLSSTS